MDPGESGGQCVAGAPPTGDYWAAYGLMLIHNAGYAVDNTRQRQPMGDRRRRARPPRAHPRKHASRTHTPGPRRDATPSAGAVSPATRSAAQAVKRRVATLRSPGRPRADLPVLQRNLTRQSR